MLQVVATFGKVKNSIELEWVLNRLESKFGELLSEASKEFNRSTLQLAWQRIDGFAPVLGMFSSSKPKDLATGEVLVRSTLQPDIASKIKEDTQKIAATDKSL